MWRTGFFALGWLFAFTGFFNQAGICQHIGLDTQQIEAVVREWNYANNSGSVESFENVYDDTLLFYTQTLSESRAIALKQQLFREKPYFRQRVITTVSYSPFTSGVIKCHFVKEVMEREGWKKYPSYLLVSYEGDRYRIVGESDYATDKTLRFRLELGEAMTFQNITGKPDPFYSDSMLVPPLEDPFFSLSNADYGLSSLDSLMKPLDPLKMFPQLSSMGVITIPRGYVFLLVAFLALGGLTIFIADSVRRPKRRKGAVLRKRGRADRMVRDLNTQSVFEAFVITLFDPLYFRHSRPKAEKVFAGRVTEGETGPDLEFEFNHKDAHAKFAIKCLYFRGGTKNDVHLFPPDRKRAFRVFEEENEMPLHFILGLGGTPDDPKELFLVPAKVISRGVVSKTDLQPYSKSGMFFYNSVSRRLQ